MADVGFTLNGLSFDDSGSLWGVDNAGAIVRIDLDLLTATQVTTIANSDVTGSGIKNLAISIEDPGTYVNIANATDSANYTVFVDHTFDASGAAAATELENNTGAGLFGFGTDPFGTPQVLVDRLGDGTLVFTDNAADGASDVTQIAIRNDDEASVKIVGFDTVEVQIGGGDVASSLTVEGVQNGTLLTLGTLSDGHAVETGASADTVLLKADDGASNTGTIVLKTGGGNDIITLDGVNGDDGILYTIDGGTGTDTVFLTNQAGGTGVVLLDLKGVEVLDLLTGTDTEVTLTPSDVLDTESVIAFGDPIPTAHTLTVEGDAGDTVNLSGWTFDSTAGGYDIYTATVSNVPVEQFDANSAIVASTTTVTVTLQVDTAINNVIV
jgi:hypothetical protein